jgi:hypothetical protein
MKELLQKLFIKYGGYSSEEDLLAMHKLIDAFIAKMDINNDGLITKEEVFKFYKKN